jgi:hypothetical protein
MCVKEMAEAMIAPPMTEEREHAEENAQDALLDEGIGDELPDFTMRDGEGLEDEMAEKNYSDVRRNPVQQANCEESGNVGQDEFAGDASKSRKTERDWAGARHSCFPISS